MARDPIACTDIFEIPMAAAQAADIDPLTGPTIATEQEDTIVMELGFLVRSSCH